MNTRKNLITLTGLAFLAVGGWSLVTACSSDNVTPSGGGDASLETGSSSGGGSGSGSGSSSGSSGATDDSGGGGDATEGGSSSGAEAGNCMSDAANCSSCTTPVTDPYNACSSFVTNCVPFDDSKVPTHPTL